MLGARRIALRTAGQACSAERLLRGRLFSDASGTPARDSTPKSTPKGSAHGKRRNIKVQKRLGCDAKQGDGWKQAAEVESGNGKTAGNTPSLIEQLFPEETKRYQERQRAAREVPQLPLDITPPHAPAAPRAAGQKHSQHKSATAQQLEAEMEATEAGIAVLVLRNASKSLTEEDFRRVIPQGQHIEGWTLQEGDIMKVIPARDMRDLEQSNVYYILFSSAMSAFIYQGHITRIHRLAAAHTPHSTAGTIPPPPGWMVEGLHVHAAIQAYALVPPNQRLELRQLRPPLAPGMESIVRNGGYHSLVNRDAKMPFEARLTMEGPQLQPSTVRHIIMESGKQRGMSWSGGDNFGLSVTRWEEKVSINPSSRSSWTERSLAGLEKDPNAGQISSELQKTTIIGDGDSSKALEAAAKDGGKAEKKRRTLSVVLVIGFHTERAAQSFVAHWHRRPLQLAKVNSAFDEDELPPIANVSMLW